MQWTWWYPLCKRVPDSPVFDLTGRLELLRGAIAATSAATLALGPLVTLDPLRRPAGTKQV